MKLKAKDPVIQLKLAGYNFPRTSLQMTLKRLELPPYMKKEKAIVPL
tara:strand:- start:620 stop:760 length:141 start_codon:yes stop_codon:yes gene_type:complete